MRNAATILWIALTVLPRTIAAEAPAAERPSTLRILFVGNSLTYTNDMPRLVQQIAAAAGQEIETATVAFPNSSLGDHLNDSRTLAALARPWDIVVLQQGPSALESSRQILLKDAQSFAAVLREKGDPKIAFLAVWPANTRRTDFDRVAESYRLAAAATGGIVIPAGTAWQTVLRDHPGIHLYSPDGFHPSALGSYLTALSVYRILIGPIPRTLPAHCTIGPDYQLSPGQCRTLIEAAEGAAGTR